LKKSAPPALLAAFVANLIYGLNYVIAKGIMPDYLQPRSIILLRVTAAALVFGLISHFAYHEKVSRNDLLRLAVAAVFGVAMNQLMFFEGLNLTTPINASIIMVGVPIIVLGLSAVFLKEKLTIFKLAGVLLGFSGAAFLILNSGSVSFASGKFTGNLLILGNATSYAIYLILIKPLLAKYKPMTIMRWVFFFGALYVIPISMKKALAENWAVIPLQIWMSVAYVIVFTTIIAYFLNNYSLSHVTPSANSAFIYTQPLIATSVSVIIGQDTPRIIHLIAALLIFAGVYLVTRPQRKKIPWQNVR